MDRPRLTSYPTFHEEKNMKNIITLTPGLQIISVQNFLFLFFTTYL